MPGWKALYAARLVLGLRKGAMRHQRVSLNALRDGWTPRRKGTGPATRACMSA